MRFTVRECVSEVDPTVKYRMSLYAYHTDPSSLHGYNTPHTIPHGNRSMGDLPPHYLNGKLHCTTGPAVTQRATGIDLWYLNGVRIASASPRWGPESTIWLYVNTTKQFPGIEDLIRVMHQYYPNAPFRFDEDGSDLDPSVLDDRE